jgi:hypothetical protein
MPENNTAKPDDGNGGTLREALRERQSFDRDTKSIFEGDPLAHVAHVLTIWHKMAPGGTYRQMLAIAANEVTAASERIRALESAGQNLLVAISKSAGATSSIIAAASEDFRTALSHSEPERSGG